MFDKCPSEKDGFEFRRHDFLGMVYLIVYSIDIIGKQHFKKEIKERIEEIVQFYYKASFPLYKIPACQLIDDHDDVFIYRAQADAISLFLTAYKHYGHKKYLLAAFNCGKSIWNTGILIKENGIRNDII
jgi:hypothetical protein